MYLSHANPQVRYLPMGMFSGGVSGVDRYAK